MGVGVTAGGPLSVTTKSISASHLKETQPAQFTFLNLRTQTSGECEVVPWRARI